MSLGRIRAAVIVVPVHDEEMLLAACLDSIETAISSVDIPCEVRVVLDACSDGSADIAAQHPFVTMSIAANAVGVARARGIASALSVFSGLPSRQIWIANTDADSTVPKNWLTTQLELAASGTDVVVGTVRPDFNDLAPNHQDLWLRTHLPGAPNGHVHGANLGVRASTYLAARGFSGSAEHEDVRLVESCRQVGATVTASDTAEVSTSGRFTGRTPGGYAGYLRDQAKML
ncbi:glycosyltransferase involved in cell wall biosynthesis [Microbacterium endophyticum]|uniref:4,4'-diaponeurosporenoate glycosyltransferase n=1 Tax=Microbacterium endophyticum TaxID=1526412 RepID=A0A7W4YN16_9MICO|nr:glycosyltransferase family A protein [Microbacterium endophyticum]MBB2975251.1 glycosyltransferase involved in cell wall biosynthesis [Microbacterium endophyticum]NIK35730.1 glycosyltransferase involved in cell wall biosynthesis [Microbacterium endophyticum]